MPKRIGLNPKLKGFDKAVQVQKNRFENADKIETASNLRAKISKSSTAQKTKNILRNWANYKADHSGFWIDLWDKWLIRHLNLDEVSQYYEKLIRQTNLSSFDEQMQMNPDMKEIFLSALACEETAFGAIKIASDYAGKYLKDGKWHLLRSGESGTIRASASWDDGFRYNQSLYGKDLVTMVQKDEEARNGGMHTPADDDSDSMIASAIRHEYGHEMVYAITWLLLDKLKRLPAKVKNDEEKLEIEKLFLSTEHLVERILRRMLKTEGGTTGKAVSRIRTDDTLGDGISEYGSTCPPEFISEAIANWRSTAPKSPKRTKLGDAAEKLFQGGLSGVVDQLYDIIENNPDLQLGSSEVNTADFMRCSEAYTDEEKKTLKKRMGGDYEKMSPTLTGAMLGRYRRIKNNKLTNTEIEQGRSAADAACKVMLRLKERYESIYNKFWKSELAFIQANRYSHTKEIQVLADDKAMDNMINKIDKINQIIKIIFDHSQCDKIKKISDILLRAGWTESWIQQGRADLEKLCQAKKEDDIIVSFCEMMAKQTDQVVSEIKKMNQSLDNTKKKNASSDRQELFVYKAEALFSEQKARCTPEEKKELMSWVPGAEFDKPEDFARLRWLRRINENGANLSTEEKEIQKEHLFNADRFFAHNKKDNNFCAELYEAEIGRFQKTCTFQKAKTAEESAKIFNAMKEGMIVAIENTLHKISAIHRILDSIDSVSRFITKQETKNTFGKIEKVFSQTGLTQAQIDTVITGIQENWMKEIREATIKNTLEKIEKRKGVYSRRKDQKTVDALGGLENALKSGKDVDEKELKKHSISYASCFPMKEDDDHKKKLSDMLFKQMIDLAKQDENQCGMLACSTKGATTIDKLVSQEGGTKSCKLMTLPHFQSVTFDSPQISKKDYCMGRNMAV